MSRAAKAMGLNVIAGLWLGFSCLFGYGIGPGDESASAPGHEKRVVRELESRYPDKPTISPSWSIPVESLGFAAPGPNYLGMRNTLASLDFLGEDRLLFTFRVPALLKREPGSAGSQTQRAIRAVVISISSGAVLAVSDWTVHDRWRYLWPLDDNHFLLRDGETLYEGDAGLNRKPLLHFPGPLLSIELSPGQDYIVTNSEEPAKEGTKSRAGSGDNSDAGEPDMVFRILSRATEEALLVQRVRLAAQLPLVKGGYLSALSGKGSAWEIAFHTFSGQTRLLDEVKSTCAPEVRMLSETVALVSACSDSDHDALMALTTDGDRLWTDLDTGRLIWPIVRSSRNGLRFAREAVYVSHSVNGTDPVAGADIRGQLVRVFDSASGEDVFEVPVTPVLDAGGNLAVSPSGGRVAVLNGSAIQVFQLSAPPTLPGLGPTNGTR